MKKHKFSGALIILAIFIIVGLVIAYVSFSITSPTKESVSASLELLYDGATKGLAPNGQSFSIDSIRNENLLNLVLEDAGLSGIITAEDFSRNLIVRGQYPSDVIDQIKRVDSLFSADSTRSVGIKEYFPTTFKIIIYNTFPSKLNRSQLKQLLSSLLEKYKTEYVAMYKAGIDLVELDAVFDSDSHDYAQALDAISMRLNIIKRYADELYNADSKFALDDGTNFNSMVLRANTIQENELNNLAANITLSAISKNVHRLRGQYLYEIQDLQYQQQALEAELLLIEELIRDYALDSTMYFSSGDGVITVEANSKETYESLVAKKSDITDQLSSIRIDIEDKQKKADDLEVAAEISTEQQIAATEASLKALKDKITVLFEDFNSLSAEYNARYVREEDVKVSNTSYSSSSIASMTFIKTVIKNEIPCCAAALCIIFFIGIIKEIKRSKYKSKGA